MKLSRIEKDFIHSLILNRHRTNNSDYFTGYTGDEPYLHSQMESLSERFLKFKHKSKNLYLFNNSSEFSVGQFICITNDEFWRIKCRSMFTVTMIHECIERCVTPELEGIHRDVSRYLEEFDKSIQDRNYQVIPVSDEEEDRVVSCTWINYNC